MQRLKVEVFGFQSLSTNALVIILILKQRRKNMYKLQTCTKVSWNCVGIAFDFYF